MATTESWVKEFRNKPQLAIFGFSNASHYYGLGNAMKMIIYGAKPQLPKTNSD
tara:strand:+ start:160 stop:318 length:159 start_codon:yes stop_codon:yes gene_type:complete